MAANGPSSTVGANSRTPWAERASPAPGQRSAPCDGEYGQKKKRRDHHQPQDQKCHGQKWPCCRSTSEQEARCRCRLGRAVDVPTTRAILRAEREARPQLLPRDVLRHADLTTGSTTPVRSLPHVRGPLEDRSRTTMSAAMKATPSSVLHAAAICPSSPGPCSIFPAATGSSPWRTCAREVRCFLLARRPQPPTTVTGQPGHVLRAAGTEHRCRQTGRCREHIEPGPGLPRDWMGKYRAKYTGPPSWTTAVCPGGRSASIRRTFGYAVFAK